MDIQSRTEKHKCLFCGGITYDDMRGNCSACGAPRLEKKEKFSEQVERDFRDAFSYSLYNTTARIETAGYAAALQVMSVDSARRMYLEGCFDALDEESILPLEKNEESGFASFPLGTPYMQKHAYPFGLAEGGVEKVVVSEGAKRGGKNTKREEEKNLRKHMRYNPFG